MDGIASTIAYLFTPYKLKRNNKLHSITFTITNIKHVIQIGSFNTVGIRNNRCN